MSGAQGARQESYADPADLANSVQDARAAARDEDSADGPRFTLLRPSELASMARTEWLIDGVLPCASSAAIIGSPGGGKSFVALDMALSLTYGLPWLGTRIARPRPVLYIAAEGAHGLYARIRAWQSYHGAGKRRRPFRVVAEPVMLEHANSDVRYLLASFHDFEPELVIIDTLNHCYGYADENSARDMSGVLSSLAEIRNYCNATTLLIHHTKKGSGTVERGSTVLRADLDTLISVGKGKHSIQVKCEKMRDGAPFPTMRAALIAEHYSAVLIPKNSLDAEPECTPRQRTVLQALADLGADASSAGDWEKASVEAGNTPNAFWKHRKALEENGLVRRLPHGKGYEVGERGRQVLAGVRQ